ncbi:MAG TPA: FAD binding domain-containing protein, partial [Alphaproteobacteria bacterium]|nr:FAD binding domain-containing protein [Alphaproteobacteria bacterium]
MFAKFDLDRPKRLEEAVALLANGNGAAILPLAGGTNLIVDIRARRLAPDRLVSLSRIGELRWMRCS